MAEIVEEIPSALDGERLDRVVALVAEISRSEAAAVIAAGGVQVDGVVATTGKVRLRVGQVVGVEPSTIPRPEPPRADPTIPLAVVFEDEHVVVVDKAPGLVVHPGAGNADGTLVNAILARYPEVAGVGDPMRPGIVHRLDVGTSGLLVVARTAAAYSALVEMLSQHDVERVYTALVWGRPDVVTGTIDAPIGRDPRDPLRMAVVASGKEARTHYRVDEELGDVSLLTCRLETGRTHQIRVHLAAVGHPVVGDATYGGQRARLRLDRPFLHAGELHFRHPITGAPVDVVSVLPPDLAAIVERCRAEIH